MGFCGGDKAWQPYYVLIPSTLDEFNLFLQYSTYLVEPNIHLDNNDVLELEAGTTMLFNDDDYGITVNSGGTLTAEGTSTHDITLKQLNEDEYWLETVDFHTSLVT